MSRVFGDPVDDGNELWSQIRPAVARKLLLAAIEAFAENGFHGTSTRDIAQRAGLSPAGVYVYFPTKESLLFRISERAHAHVLDVVRAQVGGRSAIDDLHGLVRAFVTWHARNAPVAQVSQRELHGLSGERLHAVQALRRELTGVLRQVVERGLAEGHFRVEDPASATRAVLSMGIDVARWFDPRGQLGPDELGELYAGYSLALVGAPPPPRVAAAPARALQRESSPVVEESAASQTQR